MPPKSRGGPKKTLHPDGSTEQVFDVISIGDSSDSSLIMTGSKPTARAKEKGKGKASAIPDVYQDMLAEALPLPSEVSERPLKRRRVGRRDDVGPSSSSRKLDEEQTWDDDEEDIDFEDVPGQDNSVLVDDESASPPEPQQTTYRSDVSDSESELDWDTIDFDAKPQEEPHGDLELTLKTRPPPIRKTATLRRRVVTKEEKVLRLQIHKMHLLCLLAYVDKRNDWCSDEAVMASLRPLLTKKMIKFLNPSEDLSQFGRTDSLKRGLDDVAKMWRAKYSITARGMRRALWAEDEKDLQNVSLSTPFNGQY